MKILGIAGRKQVGKSTLADYVGARLGDRCIEMSLAWPLKNVLHVLGVPVEAVFGCGEEKEARDLDSRKWLSRTSDLVSGVSGLVSGRDLLQIIGTEVVRKGKHELATEETLKVIRCYLEDRGVELGPRAWIELAGRRLERLYKTDEGIDTVVVPDVRFKNEVEWIQEAAGVVVMLQRFGQGVDSHASENGLEGAEFDLVVPGCFNRTLEDLWALAGVIARGL